MASEGLYKEVLMDHFRHPRNKGELEGATITCRGSNPSCGDDVEVGLFLEGNVLQSVKFRGRGCSICLAASSMMTTVVAGRTQSDAQKVCQQVRLYFGQQGGADAATLPDDLEALSAVRDYPARSRCVLLSWQALSDALAGLGAEASA